MLKQCGVPTLVLVICALAFPLAISAQNYGEVSFGYDTNGNRVSCSIQFSKDNRDDSKDDSLFLTRLSDWFGVMEVQLFPNPTPDCFSVSIKGESEIEGQVVLFTLEGEAIEEKTMRGGTVAFDLSGRSSGLYLVRLTVNGTSKAWKVLKK